MKRALALAAIVAAIAAAPALAQETETAQLMIDDIDMGDFPTVVITVTVPFEMNGLDLTPDNFFISEDGRGVSLGVEQLPAEELQVALVIDTSGSMQGAPINAAKDAVAGFVDGMPPDVELALLRFGDTSELLVPFTTDRAPIASGVEALTATGETALYDGLIQAVESFPDGTEKRRTIVLLTDGADSGLGSELQEALVALIGSDARLLIVELDSPEIDRTTLNTLETATGGTVVPASDPDALEGIYSEVASDLINQYRLTYTSFGDGPTPVVVAVRTPDIVAQGATLARFPVAPPVVDATTTTAAPTTTTTQAPAEALPFPLTVDVPWYASTTGLMVGAAAVFIAAALVLLLLVPTRRSALAALGSLASINVRREGRLSELTNKATLFAEDAIQRGGGDSTLRAKLDQAGLQLRAGEFLLIVFAALLVAVVGGFLFWGILVAVALGGIVVLAAWAILNWLGTRRATKFRLQLPDTLQLISGSLRAGFGMNQAITAVANEQDSPSREEFARAQLEIHLGKEVEDALRSMAVRTQSEDLPWVAEAIEIHREIGGDIADLLDQVATTVRERERVRGQIQVLSAEGKVSGAVLVVLPFAIAGITLYVAPDYLAELTKSTVGQIMLASGVISMIIGILWIRRIVRLEF